MKRLLLITFNFPPSTAAGVYRSARFVRWLPRHGWRISVLTVRTKGTPNAEDLSGAASVHRTAHLRPVDLLSRLRRLARPQESPEPRETIAAEFAQLPPRSPANAWKRFKDTISLLLTFPDSSIGWVFTAIPAAFRLVRRDRVDAIFTSGPPHSSHLIGWALRNLTRKPWIADFRDPWSRRTWLEDHERAAWRLRGMARLERLIVRRADRVILNTDRLYDDFRRAYPDLPRSKFLCIPNGYDPTEFDLSGTPAPRSGGAFRICHAGTLYRRRNPIVLLRAVRALIDRGLFKEGDIELEFIGRVLLDGTSIDEEARTLGLAGCVRVLPHMPHEECLKRMAQADALLVVQPETETQVPGKLYEYMYLDKPLLAISHAGATSEIVRDNDLGEVANPDSLPEVIEALSRLVRNARSGIESPRRAKALSRHHIESLTRHLHDTLSELLDDRKARGRSPAHTTV